LAIGLSSPCFDFLKPINFPGAGAFAKKK